MKNSNQVNMICLSLAIGLGLLGECFLLPGVQAHSESKNGNTKKPAISRADLGKFAIQYQEGQESQINALQAQLVSCKRDNKSLRAVVKKLSLELSELKAELAAERSNGADNATHAGVAPINNEDLEIKAFLPSRTDELASSPAPSAASFAGSVGQVAAGETPGDSTFGKPSALDTDLQFQKGGRTENTASGQPFRSAWESPKTEDENARLIHVQKISGLRTERLSVGSSGTRDLRDAYIRRLRVQLLQAMQEYPALRRASGYYQFSINSDGSPDFSSLKSEISGVDAGKVQDLIRRAGPYRPFVEAESSNNIELRFIAGGAAEPVLNVEMLL